jgi:AcrR family transcriptional regulator
MRRTPSALQDRSVVTRDLLCDAAEALLREGGLARCTIQDVAARSGRSAGSIYRRFGDKDGMIEAVIARYLERTLAGNEKDIRALALRHPDLSGRLKAVVRGVVAGRRRDWRLVEAFREAAETSSGASLPAAFDRMRAVTVGLIEQALRDCEPGLAAPGKARAIDFAMAILTRAPEAMMRDPALNDGIIRAELHKMLLFYLTADVSTRRR